MAGFVISFLRNQAALPGIESFFIPKNPQLSSKTSS